jgi:Protein of unknown function (DUF2892)
LPMDQARHMRPQKPSRMREKRKTSQTGDSMNENTTAESDRVRRHTSPEILDEIDERIAQSIRFYSTQSDSVIQQRIEELDREWDMERRLETNASVAVVVTTMLGLTVSKKWFLLTAVVGAFLFQHAVGGWCPPVPILRRLGTRTRKEIEREKYALKALRGDFKELAGQRPQQNPKLVAQTLQAINS